MKEFFKLIKKSPVVDPEEIPNMRFLKDKNSFIWLGKTSCPLIFSRKLLNFEATLITEK